MPSDAGEGDRGGEGGRDAVRAVGLALGGAEEQGRPLEVVEERDHDVDGHDDGEPAEARVDGRGEDGDLGEEADDARRQSGQAEQEEAQERARPAGVEAYRPR